MVRKAKLSKKTCFRCAKPFPDALHKCPSCGAWNVDAKPKTNDCTLLLSEVQPKPVPRVRTGLVDHVVSSNGEGLVISSVVLFGGAPGAGKSTIALQLAHALATALQGESLYIASEETPEDIAERAKRLECDASKIRVYPCTGEDDLRSVILARKPKAVIVDSVNDLVGDPEMVAPFATGMRALAHEFYFPVILIAHVTKELDFAGFMSDQHAVDCTISLFAEDDETEIRQMNVHKNRHGRANKSFPYLMTEKGLFPVEQDEDEDE